MWKRSRREQLSIDESMASMSMNMFGLDTRLA